MENMKELKIRISEAIRIYKDSPNTTLTYADFVRIYEDLLLVIERIESSKVGFTNGE